MLTIESAKPLLFNLFFECFHVLKLAIKCCYVAYDQCCKSLAQDHQFTQRRLATLSSNTSYKIVLI